MTVRVERHGPVTVVTLDRAEVRNAVDTEHATALYEAFLAFDADDDAAVAVLHGAGGTFCAVRTSRRWPQERCVSPRRRQRTRGRWARRVCSWANR